MTSSKPAQLTADDQAMLAWLGRVGYATGLQVSRRFDRPLTTVYRRLGWMADGELLAHHRPYRTAGVYLPTRRGLTWSPVTGEPPKVSSLTYNHDLAVVDLLVSLELDGHQVVTLREMRHRTRLARERGNGAAAAGTDYRVQLPGAAGGWFYPDLVVETTGRRWGVEVELTPKASRRLRRIVRGWVAAPVTQYTGVVYHASGAALPGLRTAVAAAHAEGFVRLRPHVPLAPENPADPGADAEAAHAT